MSQHRDIGQGNNSDISSDESDKDDGSLSDSEVYKKFEQRKALKLKSGGSYKEVCDSFPRRKGVLEVNHVIPKASYKGTPFAKIKAKSMPSIVMRHCDHRGLQSTVEKSYREILRSFLEDGNFFQALRIEITVMWENNFLADYEYDFEQMLRYCRDQEIANIPSRNGVRNGRLISSAEYEELMKLYRDLRDDPNLAEPRAMTRIYNKNLPTWKYLPFVGWILIYALKFIPKTRKWWRWKR